MCGYSLTVQMFFYQRNLFPEFRFMHYIKKVSAKSIFEKYKFREYYLIKAVYRLIDLLCHIAA